MILIVLGSLSSLLCSYYCVASIYTTLLLPTTNNNKNNNNLLYLYQWGSYNPGYYFSFKKQSQYNKDKFILTNGILWKNNNKRNNNYRHRTNQDELDKFEYTYHDGNSFGIENIVDSKYGLMINASFIIYDNYTWLQHFDVNNVNSDEKSFLYYFGMDIVDKADKGDKPHYELLHYFDDNNDTVHIYGKVKSHFYMKFTGSTNINLSNNNNKISSNIQTFFTIEKLIASMSNSSVDVVYYENNNYFDDNIKVQDAKKTWDKLFNYRKLPLIQSNFDELISAKRLAFDDKFDKVFNLKSKNFTPQEIDVAKRALSNVLGGIGWFYGKSRIGDGIDINSTGHVLMAPNNNNNNNNNNEYVSLLTATPSRTSFPRGFLWDEGFHQLLIHRWNVNITMQIISDWMNSMNRDGWMPREMILGDEANSRVPDEFITQRVNIANPPTFFLVVENILTSVLSEDEAKECATTSDNKTIFLQSIFHSLKKWLKWYIVSQKGELPGSYRWRGRSYNDNKLVPNTLASGLDDYPRAQLPTSNEYHVDLASWVIKSCQILLKLSEFLGVDTDQDLEFIRKTYLESVSQYKKLHYSSSYKGYFDYGMISNTARISSYVHIHCQNPVNEMVAEFQLPLEYVQSKPSKLCPDNYSKFLSPVMQNGEVIIKEKVTSTEPMELQHIPRVGYTTLFPLLLNILEPNCTSLSEILDIIEDREYLWTDYGLRSLATNDTFYNHPNGPGDNPYWRGPIWINVNYLTLKALYYYSGTDSVYHTRIADIYTRLRTNIQNTIINSYTKTGFFWEQYSDSTGEGIRGHPFTGWTTLLVNIMSEMY
jgi:mannosyl-oligosaccharide glucosidase